MLAACSFAEAGANASMACLRHGGVSEQQVVLQPVRQSVSTILVTGLAAAIVLADRIGIRIGRFSPVRVPSRAQSSMKHDNRYP